MSAPRDTVFRETFLARFQDAEEVTAVRLLGDLLLTLCNEAGHTEEGKSTPTASEVAGAGADFRRLAEYLEAVVDAVEGNEVSPEEERLGMRARDWKRKAADLTREIEAAVTEAEAETEPVEAPARSGRDLTDEEIWRRADRCSWIRQALRDARGVETALQAIPRDGPDPDLQGSLLRDASDLGTGLELLLDGSPHLRAGRWPEHLRRDRTRGPGPPVRDATGPSRPLLPRRTPSRPGSVLPPPWGWL